MEEIGLCFPSRFPQGMLSNLAESEELQQQFYLFQLQEQDKRLLELDTGLAEVSMLGAARVPHGDPGACPEPPSCPCAQALGTASEAAVPEVKVLTLSPRCWPVSPFCYMDEPGRFFSASLSSPLHEFADFCQRSECRGSGCVWGLAGPRPSAAAQPQVAEPWGVLRVPSRAGPWPLC